MRFFSLVLLLLFFTTSVVPVSAQITDTPVIYNCLGACPTDVPTPTDGIAPSITVTTVPISEAPISTSPSTSQTPSSAPSTIPSTSPSTVPSPSPTAPCVVQGQSFIQSSNGDHHRKKKWRKKKRGFFGQFFQFLIRLIEELLRRIGLQNPCGTDVTPTPSPSISPSTAPSLAPSVVPTVGLAPTSVPATAIPTEVSTNWGGYAFITPIPVNAKLATSWTVPTNDCSLGDGTTSPWPGMGGFDSSDGNIAQLGNDDACTNGVASYPAWSEAYPASSIYYTNPMSAGDQMTASVTFTGNGAFTTTMTNTTKGWTLNIPMAFETSYVPQSGEVIFEALGNNTAPKFSGMNFTNSIYYPDGQQQVPLASAPNLKAIDTGTNDALKIKTGPINGGSFTSTWLRY